MIFVATDILNPYKRDIISQDTYLTLIDFLIDKFPNGFKRPTDISVNGHEVKIDDYDISLQKDDVIVLLDRAALPVGLIGGWFITALANLAISVTLSYVANKLFAPDAPQEQGTPSPVYNLNSAQNTARYGAPIPIIYGKVRMYPSMIAQPFYRFEDNVEYLYHTLCVGQGTNTTDEILIAEDNITSAGDLQWKLLYQSDFYNIPLKGYGYHITNTLETPSNMKLINDTANPEYGESEKYRISKDASQVEIDYIYPNGLSFVRGDGSYDATYTAFTYRIYTLSGTTYTQVASGVIDTNAYSIDAIQKTYVINTSSYTQDIYISFEKTYGANDSRTTNDTYIKRVKEIFPNEDFTQLYGDITVLVCKIKATNAVSSAGQLKVNGYFTRTDVGNTMAEVLTDIYTNTTYGGGLSVSDLNFPTTTETVNCAYDSNMTIFDAMRRPAIAQGYSLYLAGMDVILKKDGANNITTGMYNEMNILRNSFKAQYLFKEEYPANDGFKCTYIDGNGWVQKSEIYPSTSSRPQVVDLFGVVDYSYLWPKGTNLIVTDSITNIALFGTTWDVKANGSYAFATSSNKSNLIAINVLDTSNIFIESTYNSTTYLGGATGIEISGNYAYIATLGNRVTIIDISNPSSMSFVGSYLSAFSDIFYEIAIHGNVAYVTGNSLSSILAIDISNPSSPTLLHRLVNASLDKPYGIAINGNIAYTVGTVNGSITAIDISNPSSMSIISTFDPAILTTCRNIVIKDNVAFITSDSNDSFVSIDISDPSNMVVLDSITNSTILNGAWGLDITYDIAVISSNISGTIASIDISDPSNMIIVDSVTNTAINGGRSVSIYGNTAFTSSYSIGAFVSVDIT